MEIIVEKLNNGEMKRSYEKEINDIGTTSLVARGTTVVGFIGKAESEKESTGGVGIRIQHEYNGSPDETGYGFSDETLWFPL